MPYVNRTVKAGPYIFTEKHFALRIGKKNIPRGPNINYTTEQQQKINDFNKKQNLIWLFCENFRNGDNWITLTYNKGKRPESIDGAVKCTRSFIRKLREHYKKQGMTLVYMANTERGTKGGIHHHIVIRGDVDYNIIARAWKTYGGWQAKTIGADNIGGITDDILNLAKYFIKGRSEASEKKYITSRYLRKPEITTEIIAAQRWTSKPRPKKGYVLLDVYDGFHDFFGRPYQDYIQVRRC